MLTSHHITKKKKKKNREERKEIVQSIVRTKTLNGRKSEREIERANLRGGRSELRPVESNLRADGGEVDTTMAGRLREQVLGISMRMAYSKK